MSKDKERNKANFRFLFLSQHVLSFPHFSFFLSSISPPVQRSTRRGQEITIDWYNSRYLRWTQTEATENCVIIIEPIIVLCRIQNSYNRIATWVENRNILHAYSGATPSGWHFWLLRPFSLSLFRRVAAAHSDWGNYEVCAFIIIFIELIRLIFNRTLSGYQLKSAASPQLPQSS